MALLQQFSFVCAPAPLQHAVLEAFDLDMSDHIAAYRRKRDLVAQGLAERFGLVKPDGSFYAFPRYPEGVEAEQFVAAALDEKVLIVPGAAFSERSTHFRLSFAAGDEVLQEGLARLNRIAEQLAPGGS
jgi:aspartate aminotransferase/aminotransferase